MKPLFSIILPVYNVVEYLQECLDSILKQNFTDWEVICVDDGSTDGSGVILDEYAAKDSRFKVIHQANAGVSAARNAGLKVLSGEWLMFADGDDAYRENAFSEIQQLVSSERYDAFFFGRPPEWNGEKAISTYGGVIKYSIDVPQSGRVFLLKKEVLLGFPHIRCFRASMFKDIEFPLGVAMMEDTINLVHCLSVKARWAWTDLQHYLYRVRSDSASRVVPIGRPEEVMDAVFWCVKEAKESLNFSSAEVVQYAKSHRKVLHRYLWESFASSEGRDLREIVSKYWKIETYAKTHIVTFSMRVRCKIAYLFNKPIGFGIIRFIDYIYYGIKRRKHNATPKIY